LDNGGSPKSIRIKLQSILFTFGEFVLLGGEDAPGRKKGWPDYGIIWYNLYSHANYIEVVKDEATIRASNGSRNV